MPAHQTQNDLASNTKSVVVKLLNARLADAIDLALLTKQAHWNVKRAAVHRRSRDDQELVPDRTR